MQNFKKVKITIDVDGEVFEYAYDNCDFAAHERINYATEDDCYRPLTAVLELKMERTFTEAECAEN